MAWTVEGSTIRPRPGRVRRAFALAEGGVLAGVVGLLVCVVAVGAGQERRSAGLAGSLANLRRIGESTGSYAADFDDQFWTFTWSVQDNDSNYFDLQNPEHHIDAIAYQAVDIVRRRSRKDVPGPNGSRFVPPWLSTLVLVDYLDEAVPAEWAVSPGDEMRLAWQRDPRHPPVLGEQGGTAWDAIYGPFGSSYTLMPAFFAPDERIGDGPRTIEQYKPNHALYWIRHHITYGKRRTAEVSFPAQKAHMAERASFFFGPRPEFWLHREARVLVLMADGSASPRTTAESNASFFPNAPDDTARVTLLDYAPNTIYEIPSRAGDGEKDLDIEGAYKWTRHGLQGVDFAGERAD